MTDADRLALAAMPEVLAEAAVILTRIAEAEADVYRKSVWFVLAKDMQMRAARSIEIHKGKATT